MEIKTIKGNAFDTTHDTKVIIKSSIAKALLKRGNKIVDIKPDKDDPDHKRSVFVFEQNEKFNNDLNEIMLEKKRSKDAFEARVQRVVEERLKELEEKEVIDNA